MAEYLLRRFSRGPHSHFCGLYPAGCLDWLWLTVAPGWAVFAVGARAVAACAQVHGLVGSALTRLWALHSFSNDSNRRLSVRWTAQPNSVIPAALWGLTARVGICKVGLRAPLRVFGLRFLYNAVMLIRWHHWAAHRSSRLNYKPAAGGREGGVRCSLSRIAACLGLAIFKIFSSRILSPSSFPSFLLSLLPFSLFPPG